MSKHKLIALFAALMLFALTACGNTSSTQPPEEIPPAVTQPDKTAPEATPTLPEEVPAIENEPDTDAEIVEPTVTEEPEATEEPKEPEAVEQPQQEEPTVTEQVQQGVGDAPKPSTSQKEEQAKQQSQQAQQQVPQNNNGWVTNLSPSDPIPQKVQQAINNYGYTISGGNLYYEHRGNTELVGPWQGISNSGLPANDISKGYYYIKGTGDMYDQNGNYIGIWGPETPIGRMTDEEWEQREQQMHQNNIENAQKIYGD